MQFQRKKTFDSATFGNGKKIPQGEIVRFSKIHYEIDFFFVKSYNNYWKVVCTYAMIIKSSFYAMALTNRRKILSTLTLQREPPPASYWNSNQNKPPSTCLTHKNVISRKNYAILNYIGHWDQRLHMSIKTNTCRQIARLHRTAAPFEVP